MPRIDIPGVGPVEFPDTMSAADIKAEARRLHETRGRAPETSEAHAPAPESFSMLDSLTGRNGGPSTRGFIEGAARGAADLVSSVPRLVRGLTKINPADIPGQIVEGVRDRVSSYANDPLATIYDDPLSFLGDAATVASLGASAAAPLRTGARAVGSVAEAAAPKVAAAGATALDVAAGAAKEAAISKLTGRSGTLGAIRGARAKLLDRVLQKAAQAPEEAIAAAAEKLPAGYDRYMPNTSAAAAVEAEAPAAARLPGEFSPDLPPPSRPSSFADDQIERYTKRTVLSPEEQKLAGELAKQSRREPGALAPPPPNDAQVVDDLIREMDSNLSRVPQSKRLAAKGASAEVDALIAQMQKNLEHVPMSKAKQPRALLPEITQSWRRDLLREQLGVDMDAVDEAMRTNSPDVLAGRMRPRYR